jgi:hypothetical protein
MGVPANPAPVLNVSPAAAAAEQQRNPPRSFDVVWSLNHVDDVGELCILFDHEAPYGVLFRHQHAANQDVAHSRLKDLLFSGCALLNRNLWPADLRTIV